MLAPQAATLITMSIDTLFGLTTLVQVRFYFFSCVLHDGNNTFLWFTPDMNILPEILGYVHEPRYGLVACKLEGKYGNIF